MVAKERYSYYGPEGARPNHYWLAALPTEFTPFPAQLGLRTKGAPPELDGAPEDEEAEDQVAPGEGEVLREEHPERHNRDEKVECEGKRQVEKRQNQSEPSNGHHCILQSHGFH